MVVTVVFTFSWCYVSERKVSGKKKRNRKKVSSMSTTYRATVTVVAEKENEKSTLTLVSNTSFFLLPFYQKIRHFIFSSKENRKPDLSYHMQYATACGKTANEVAVNIVV